MDLKKLKDLFPEDQIEWRIGRCGKKANGEIWATCLAYVQARAAQDRLDSVCGQSMWKVSYRFELKGTICRLSIFDGDKWVTKEDGAEETEIESFKGGISSAFKRAASAWGIGRYLYDLEEGFASICQKGNQGARYGRLPKDYGGDVFYWLPPALPVWARPAQNESPVSSPKQQESVSTEYDNYVPLVGPFKERSLKESSSADLVRYVRANEEKLQRAMDENSEVAKRWSEFYINAVGYLEARGEWHE